VAVDDKVATNKKLLPPKSIDDKYHEVATEAVKRDFSYTEGDSLSQNLVEFIWQRQGTQPNQLVAPPPRVYATEAKRGERSPNYRHFPKYRV